MKTYRRTSKQKGWGSPSGGIPYSHYRSLGGFYAPGDEPSDCPEDQTLIAAMIALNREHGKTITARKARAIYEDIRIKDKEHHRQRRELMSLGVSQKQIDEIDAKIVFKKDPDTNLTSGYPVRAQSVSHGADPDENAPDHYHNGRRQRYKHLDGAPKEELLREIWLLDFLAGEEDCERSDVERRFESNRRKGGLVPCKVKGWWRGQNGSEPNLGDIRRYQTVGGEWIGPTNETEDKEARWMEYMRFYGTMPLLKRIWDSIYDCPIIKWTIDRAVELGMMDEDAIDDPYEWAKAYLNRALNCVQVEARKCFRKVNGYLCGRQYYIPGTYRWIKKCDSLLDFFQLPNLWDGANEKHIFDQAVVCGDVLVWDQTSTTVDQNGAVSFRKNGIQSAIGIDRWNYGCEVVEIQRQKDEFWRGYFRATIDVLEARLERKKVAAIEETERRLAEMKSQRETEERELVSRVTRSLEVEEHPVTEVIASLRHNETNRDGDGMAMRIASELQRYNINLPLWGYEMVFHKSVELGLLVYDKDGYRGRNTERPRSGITVKATSKKPTLVE